MTPNDDYESPVPPGLQDEFLSREEAARELRMHIDTVSKKVSLGVLETQRYGKHTFVTRESVRKYLNQFRHVSGK